MFFVPALDNPNTLTTDWEIRVSWPGALKTQIPKKPAPFDFNLRISIENGDHQWLPNEFFWENGRLVFKRKPLADYNFDHLPKSQYYLEPFFLFSFLPHQSLNQGKVLKLYPGFRFLSAFWKIYRWTLQQELAIIPISWGATINDQFKKGCAINKSDDFAQRKRVFQAQNTFEPNLPKNLFDKERVYYINRYAWKKPLLIPLHCLKKGQTNSIKLWWTPNKKKEHFLDDVMNIKIDFYYPDQSNLSFVLNENVPQNVLVNDWYLITTKLGQQAQITPVKQQLIRFKSHLLSQYSDNQPFRSLWTVEHYPVQTSQSKWRLLLQYFQFSNLKNDFIKVINWLVNKPEGNIETSVVDSNKSYLLKSRVVELSKTLQRINLNIPAFKKQEIDSKKIDYYKHSYRNLFVTKNSWNFAKHQMSINPLSNHTFLTDHHHYYNSINLFTTFLWKVVTPINFLINQNTIIKNNFLHYRLFLKTKKFAIKKPDHQKTISFQMNFSLLKEIADLVLDFDRYQDLKRKYSKHDVKKKR